LLNESKIKKLINIVVAGHEYICWANYGGIYLYEFQ